MKKSTEAEGMNNESTFPLIRGIPKTSSAQCAIDLGDENISRDYGMIEKRTFLPSAQTKKPRSISRDSNYSRIRLSPSDISKKAKTSSARYGGTHS